MIFATVLSLCVSATQCDDYVVDQANTVDDCQTNLIADSNTFGNVWGGQEGMQWYFNDKGITNVDVSKLVDYDYTCKAI